MVKKLGYGVVALVFLVGAFWGWKSLSSRNNRKSTIRQTIYSTKLAIPKSKSKKYHGKLKHVLAPTNFSGSAVLIKNHQIVDSYSNGVTNESSKTQNTLTTTYEIDSLQKSLTAGLVGEQIKQGRLKFTDRVSKYLPDIPGADEITIRELLVMRSGLTLKGLKVTGETLSSDELINKIVNKVKFKSDKIGLWNYQPVNYVILSKIVEEVSGKSYEQLFNQLYVKKLGLKQTEMAYSQNQRTNRASGYLLSGSGDTIKQALQTPSGAKIHSELGTGQVYMAVTDYYQVLSKLLNGSIIGKDMSRAIYVDKIGDPTGKYRGGLYESENGNYRYANGYGYGFEDYVRISPDGKNAIVVFDNHRYVGNKKIKKVVDKLSRQYLK
jgi:CubicO group peptidase (beta-lactamase class C family)